MMETLHALSSNPFLQIALLGGLLASIASGVMGSFVVIKRIASLSGSIAHSILGGIGFFYWLKYNHGQTWADPIYGAFLAGIISAFIIGWVHLRYKQKEDAAIAAIWSTGMAIGVIFISLIKGYKADFTSFLFGNILLLSTKHLLFLGVLDLVILLTTFFLYRYFVAICFDEEQSTMQDLPVTFLYFTLLGLISLSIVLLLQVIGIILVIALLTIPPTIAALFTGRLIKIMISSILLAIIFNTLGILFAYSLDIPPGATVAIICALSYVIVLIGKRFNCLKKRTFFSIF